MRVTVKIDAAFGREDELINISEIMTKNGITVEEVLNTTFMVSSYKKTSIRLMHLIPVLYYSRWLIAIRCWLIASGRRDMFLALNSLLRD